MFAIAIKEFITMIKSIKSLLIISLFISTAYFMSSFVTKNLSDISPDANAFSATTRLLVLVFGFLFVMLLSHDIMSSEISSKTIRLLLSKTSRATIIMGKFIGVSLFWLLCIGISITVISLFSNSLLWLTFLQLYSFILFAIGCCLLISTVCKSTSTSLVVALTISFVVPILGFWSMFSEKGWAKPIKLILPYSYQIKEDILLVVPVLISLGFVYLSNVYFKRGDY